MNPIEFQRARNEEQREVRRQTILATAAQMLADMPVAELSLNELSRRVGLAKSNVLRYFSSREAVLLELLDAQWREWLAELRDQLADRPDARTNLRERYESVAATMTATLVARPLLCELISVSAAVLERNISPDVARRYKTAAMANTATLADLLRERLPELSETGAMNAAAGTALATTGIWPSANPADSMLCVYEDPEFAALRLDFRTALNETLATILAGCLSRWPSDSASAWR